MRIFDPISHALACEYSLHTVQEIKKIVEPLSYLGVRHFSYLRIFDDNRYLVLSNEGKALTHFFQNVCDQGRVFQREIHTTEVVPKVWTV